MIDPPPAPSFVLMSVSIDSASPSDMARDIIFLGPFFFQERFRFTVVVLLLPVSANLITSVMPNHRARTIAQRPALFLKPPANVDIVSRYAKLRIESADGFERGLAKSHVATGNMFGLTVGQ